METKYFINDHCPLCGDGILEAQENPKAGEISLVCSSCGAVIDTAEEEE